MPLATYGVLIGTLHHFAREDQTDYGSWYHGKLYVNAPQGLHECAVDVNTPSGVGVEYRVLRVLSPTLFAPILAFPPGWTNLARNATSGALDYVRSPLLARRLGCFTVVYNPLIDLINQWIRGTDTGWRLSDGNNALDALERTLTDCLRVFVFGAFYNQGLGVHDIHMNQGDPPGRFQALDGVWQDGGVIVERPWQIGSRTATELVAFMVKFATQTMRTDDVTGLPLP